MKGTIGIDVTAEGVTQAIALAISQGYDGITVEIDSVTGEVDAGSDIAGLLREAGNHAQTIAIIRRAGGPALPIAFACKEWLVIDRVGDEGPDRTVLMAAPSWSPQPDGVFAQLSAIGNMCTRISPAKEGLEGRARETLIYALTNPGMDLLFHTNKGKLSSICAAPIQRTDDDGGTRILMASRGPGIDANGLVQAGLATLVAEGLAPLAKALGVEKVESQGETGLMLVGSIAEEQFKDRKRLGSVIDSIFSTVDGIDSLSSAVPWTLERAKLSDPASSTMLWRYPMQFKDGSWAFTSQAVEQWRLATNDSIRRWTGVETLSKEISALFQRFQTLHAQLKQKTAGPLDRPRLAAALRITDAYVSSLKELSEKFAPLAADARRRITELENALDSPPTIPIPK